MLSNAKDILFYNCLKKLFFSNVSAPDIGDKILGEPYIWLIGQKPRSCKNISENKEKAHPS